MKLLKAAAHGNLKPSCSYEERKAANFMQLEESASYSRSSWWDPSLRFWDCTCTY